MLNTTIKTPQKYDLTNPIRKGTEKAFFEEA